MKNKLILSGGNQYNIAKGSIADYVISRVGLNIEMASRELLNVLANVNCVIAVDVSGSMSEYDNTSTTRYKRAISALKKLQENRKGKSAILGFSDDVRFYPYGIPVFEELGTNLAGALRYLQIADIEGIAKYIISDGFPDFPDQCLVIARRFKTKINTIFIGNNDDMTGQDFLRKLSSITGGTHANRFSGYELENDILMLIDVNDHKQ